MVPSSRATSPATPGLPFCRTPTANDAAGRRLVPLLGRQRGVGAAEQDRPAGHLPDAVAGAGAGVVHLHAGFLLIDPLPLEHERFDERGAAAIEPGHACPATAGERDDQ